MVVGVSSGGSKSSGCNASHVSSFDFKGSVGTEDRDHARDAEEEALEDRSNRCQKVRLPFQFMTY